MITRAAVCPGAPLLVPGLAPQLAAEVPELVSACHRAVGSLTGADRILLITSGPGALDAGVRQRRASVVHRPGAVVSSSILTGSRVPPHFATVLPPHFATVLPPHIATVLPPHLATVRSPGSVPGGRENADDEPPPGVGVVVGAALLHDAGSTAPLTALELIEPTAVTTAELSFAAESRDRVALLVVADGSWTRAPDPPEGGSTRIEGVENAVSRALAAGDPAALASAAHQDGAAGAMPGAPAFAALARLTLDRPPRRSDLLFDGAPLGVGYLVATWSWD